MNNVISVIGQAIGLFAVVLGIYCLAGLAWALLTAGVLIFVAFTAMEATNGTRKDGRH